MNLYYIQVEVVKNSYNKETQTHNRTTFPAFESGLAAQENINYLHWRQSTSFETIYSEIPVTKDFFEKYGNHFIIIPIGTLEFVNISLYNMFSDKGYKNLAVINIPEQLRTEYFCKRKIAIINGDGDSILNEFKGYGDGIFVKSNKIIKADINDYYRFIDIPKAKIPMDEYFVSEELNFLAEWRAFVFRGEVLDVKQYLGDWGCAVSKAWVLEAVKTYSECPTAYTLDFALAEDSSGNRFYCVVECHNFVSCGLYGFTSHRMLQMLSQGICYEIEKSKERV